MATRREQNESGADLREAGQGRRAPATPFHPLRRVVPVALLYALAAVVWALGGPALPGGRWLAVHLFTLGVLTNLVAALTEHFARTVLHAPEAGRARTVRLFTINLGALALLVGLPADQVWLTASGGTLLLVAVLWLYADLRSMRRRSLGTRFVFVVRAYERACGAFTHGALLGLLMGTGLAGAWYGAARIAHLHVNVLGWGGLTLLATVVFFGPTIMRARIEPGADATAATAIRIGATALTLASLALLATALDGNPGLIARLVAGVGLGVYAWAVSAVCLPVLRTGRRARPSAPAWLLMASCVWFPIVAWLDAAVVLSGQFRLLDALGAAALVGVLGQAILASTAYLGPHLWGADIGRRNAGRDTLDRLGRARVAALNLGVVAVVAAAALGSAGGSMGAVAARGGWVLVTVALLAHVLLLARVRVSGARPSPAAPA